MGVMAGISTHVDACVCAVGVGLSDQPTYLIKFTNWIGINVNQEQETAAAGGKAWQGRQVVDRSHSWRSRSGVLQLAFLLGNR